MRKGFSLVELSIVLVILGLLVGGILAGKSLIRASELRAVGTEQERYMTATQAFRDKYFAIPGDMANATNFWGIADGSTGADSACYDYASTDAKTCNGNGNGILNDNSNEMYRYWQQLANAGLLEGRYTGTKSNTSSYAHTPGTNTPVSKIAGGTWAVRGYVVLSGDAQSFDGSYTQNHMFYNLQSTNNWPLPPAFKPEEAWNIDKKLDDGIPGTGKVKMRSRNGWNDVGGTLDVCTLATASTQITAAYDLDVATAQCGLYFMNAF